MKRLIVTTFFLIGIPTAQAKDNPLRQATISARVLTFDALLRHRSGNAVAIGIMFRKERKESKTMAEEMLHAFKTLERIKVQNLPLKALLLPFEGPQQLKSAIKKHGITALYLCEGLEDNIATIGASSASVNVVTMTYNVDYVMRGAAVGIVPMSGWMVKEKEASRGYAPGGIVINVAACAAAGIVFTESLFKIQGVIRLKK